MRLIDANITINNNSSESNHHSNNNFVYFLKCTEALEKK